MLKEAAPYADEWQALREQRQKEYEQMVTLMRWGALMDVTNEIAKEYAVQTVQMPVMQKSGSGFSVVPSQHINEKGRM